MDTHQSTTTWDSVRRRFPNQWLLIEAMAAHSVGDRRVIDHVTVLDHFDSGESALRRYLRLHAEDRSREMYVVHTNRAELDILEKRWLGIRSA